MAHVENQNNNRSVASILSPLGKVWNIKLIKDGSETFLKEGWTEFNKFYEIEVGYMLVFRYEGNMVFSVKVFGLNGCLKDYNQGAVNFLRRTGLKASREKSPGKYPTGTEVPSSSGKQTKRKHEPVMKKKTLHHERSSIQDELKTTSKCFAEKKPKRNVASTSQLEITMRPYHIYKFMRLPKSFGSSSNYRLEKGMITVKNAEEQTWSLKFNNCTEYNHIGRGWSEFCLKNNIQIGDRCKFKILDNNELLVTVSKT